MAAPKLEQETGGKGGGRHKKPGWAREGRSKGQKRETGWGPFLTAAKTSRSFKREEKNENKYLATFR
jgi:hypothetical protein